MAKNNRQNKSGLPGWVFFLIFFGIVNIEWIWPLWPFALVGVVLWRLGVFGGAKSASKGVSSDQRQEVRMDKYRVMTEGRTVESIDYLASAVGVSFQTALRDLQKMVAEGRLGPRAYINYVDKTVVLDAHAARAAQGQTQTRAQTKPVEGKDGSNMISRAAESDAKKKAASKKTASQKAPAAQTQDTRVYGKLKKVLLVLGTVLTVLGGLGTVMTLSEISYYYFLRTLREVIPFLSILVSGLGCLGYRGFLRKRENRFQLYAAACAGKDFVEVGELASKAGVSERKCKKDLEAMLEKDLLPATAYIDQGNGLLILKPGAAPKSEPVPEPEEDNEDRYKSILREIRKLNDDIPDEGVSRRIDEMELLTGKIFKAVQDKPEKEPQIKSFMSYYLPTTLKLLGSYAEFEKSGAQGDNITSAKAEIEQILDTLVDGFRKQLDKLYERDAMDIASDIDVLETMLRRDGLTGDGSAFNVRAGSAAAQSEVKKDEEK